MTNKENKKGHDTLTSSEEKAKGCKYVRQEIEARLRRFALFNKEYLSSKDSITVQCDFNPKDGIDICIRLEIYDYLYYYGVDGFSRQFSIISLDEEFHFHSKNRKVSDLRIKEETDLMIEYAIILIKDVARRHSARKKDLPEVKRALNNISREKLDKIKEILELEI